MDSDFQKISDHMDAISDYDGLIDDYIIIDGQVRYINECSVGELEGDEGDDE